MLFVLRFTKIVILSCKNKYLNEDRNGRVSSDSQHWLLQYTESSGVARKILWRIPSSKECLFACSHVSYATGL